MSLDSFVPTFVPLVPREACCRRHLGYAYTVEKLSTRQPDVWRTSLVAALIAIVGALLKFWYLYFDDLARARPNMFAQRVLEEGTGFFAFAVLIPAIVWASRKFRFGEQHWYRIAPIHLAITIVLSFCHTSLMAIFRMVLSPLLGMGPYDYGKAGRTSEGQRSSEAGEERAAKFLLRHLLLKSPLGLDLVQAFVVCIRSTV